MLERLKRQWARLWLKFAGLGVFGRFCMWVAGWFELPYKGRLRLSRYSEFGYISSKAQIAHRHLTLGRQIFLGDGVVICEERYGSDDAGRVHLGDRVQLYKDVIIETGANGAVSIGDATHIQPKCQFAGFNSEIQIGRRVDIAPGCVFYPYDHQILPENPIRQQPLTSKGPIIVGDDVWLGSGVIVLAGGHYRRRCCNRRRSRGHKIHSGVDDRCRFTCKGDPHADRFGTASGRQAMTCIWPISIFSGASIWLDRVPQPRGIGPVVVLRRISSWQRILTFRSMTAAWVGVI
jgi:acetyltransferase-like isoleucine patch superfamily enzyme